VDDVLGVQVLNSLADLVDVVSCYFLSESLAWCCFELFIEFTSWRILQNKVDLLLVPEETIHP